MGTWGAGIFENDHAALFVLAERDRHLATIAAVFADDVQFHLDEELDGTLFPSIIMLSWLSEYCHIVIPPTIDLVAWKTTYLIMYDREVADQEATPTFKQERRDVVSATFDRLILLNRQP